MIGSAYRDTGSFLHRYDPRVKLLLLLGWCAMLFLPVGSIWWYGAYTGFLALAAAAALGWNDLWMPVRSILPLLILVLILTPPFYRTGEPLIMAGRTVLITKDGLEEAGKLIFRFTGITLAFFLYFRTTTLQHVILTLRWYGLPYRTALVITLAFRYIPTTAQLMHNVRAAHLLREPMPGSSGAALEDIAAGRQKPRMRRKWSPSRIRRRFGDWFPVLMSVLIASVKSIPTLAVGLEFRGLGRKEKHTSWKQLENSPKVYVHLLAALLLLCAGVIPCFV